MNIFKNKLLLVLAVVSTFGLAACNDDGAEEAGEKIDNMVTDTGNAIEDACEEAKEGLGADDKDC